MKRFFFDCGTRDITASTGLLALRVLTGLMLLIGHGIPKITHYSTLKNMFYVPDFLPQTWAPACLMACIGAEVIGSALVILGFATRFAAFVVGFCMVIAGFGMRGPTPWFETLPTLVENKELPVVYLITMISIILAGAGAFSLDANIFREKRSRRW